MVAEVSSCFFVIVTQAYTAHIEITVCSDEGVK